MQTPQTPSVEDALEKATFVRLQWVSIIGAAHCIVLPKARYLEILASNPPVYSIQHIWICFPVKATYPLPASMPSDNSIWARPDPTSLRVVEHTGGRHVSVMCDLDLKGPTKALEQWRGCPRQLLRTAAKEVEDGLNVNIKIGFEIEMMFLEPDYTGHAPARPFANDAIAGRMTLRGLRGKMLDIVDEVATSLEAGGVPVWRYQTEMRDQFELSLAPAPALEAVDNLYNAREIIRAVFTKHGLAVTMMPKPFLDPQLPLNGCHMHLSLNSRDSNPVEKKVCDGFLAGALSQTSALFAFGMPLPESYSRRAMDGAGEWIGWGTENKRLPIRAMAPNRWEFRALDATANAYLYLATVLQAGLLGVKSNMPLLQSDLTVYAASPENKEQREAAGITERTPSSVLESLDFIKEDAVGGNAELADKLGPWLLRQYERARRADFAELDNVEFLERRALYMNTFE